eukprot:3637270-Alexandrium_andersonii.AAC.1
MHSLRRRVAAWLAGAGPLGALSVGALYAGAHFQLQARGQEGDAQAHQRGRLDDAGGAEAGHKVRGGLGLALHRPLCPRGRPARSLGAQR